jgi:transcription antitermination factor NusG
MPLLALETDLYPADLLDREAAVPGRAWWVLYTMSRREKELMRRLLGAGIGFYGPLVKHRKRSPEGRVRSSYLPLFAGYVFLHGDDDERRAALATNCVSRCLAVSDSDELVRDLKQVRRLIEANVPLTPEARLEAGQRIRVCSGSLAGLEGTVIKRHGQQRLLVAVEFLQQGASVQIEDCGVERID